MRLWLAGPAKLDALAPGHHYVTPPAHDPAQASVGRKLYAVAVGVSVPPLLGWMALTGDGWSLAAQWAMGTFLVVSVVSIGALLEGRRWAVGLESVRLVAAAAGLALLLGTGLPGAELPTDQVVDATASQARP